ncbi:MAG: hypothetical protein KDN22_19300 [Verrucomicrobiae bacterium]|nr:hypothetical protein [Verrucomicrobiae bacterium]
MNFRIFLALFFIGSACPAQVVFTAGSTNNLGLFEQRGNQTVQINTGHTTHNAMAVSRDGRFVTFADLDTDNFGGAVVPSANLFELDRVTGRTRELVDNQSTLGGFFNIVSSAVSLDNQFVAVGTEIQLRSGLSSNGSGRVLEIYDRATEVRVADVTAFRGGAVSDSLMMEFAGISWSPRAASFITPFYVPVVSQRGLPGNLTAIVRFDRNGSGQWVPNQVLSTPLSLDEQIPPSSVSQAYPGYSPSGQGIAYFSVHFDGAQGWVARSTVVIADASGANARNLVTFDPGYIPTGLTWSADGGQIIVSIAPQTTFGINVLNIPVMEQSLVRSVSTSDGRVTQLPGINGGVSPQMALNAGTPSVGGNMSNIAPILSRTGNGQFVLRAVGLDSAKTYRLQSSTTLNGFPNSVDFTGAQFASGIPIQTGDAQKFFRIQSL